ncbi:sodium:solute symporter [Aeromicrobium sp. CTD01-1L150]|uniref:sodium:solute symporter family protein n=1 Tax=Aeromicrobium sp. CTD01-1L150 TaxID=3341830 RepID=UPI0035C16D5F
MSVSVGLIIVYFLVMIGIGMWARARVHNSRDFLVAGQTLGFLVMAVGTFSSIQSGFGMIGHTGQAYAVGLEALVGAALFVPLAFALSWFLLGSRLYRLARQHDVFSVPDVIKLRFPGRSAHVTMSIAMFVGSVAYMTAQVTAMGVIIALIFGTSTTTGAIVGSLIVTIYTIVGGMLAGAWTDFIQGLLMIVMSLGVFVVATNTLGGWGSMLETIAASDVGFLRLDGPAGGQPLTFVYTFAMLAILGAAAQPQLITKFLMLRSHTELKWGAFVAAVAYAVTTLFAISIGLASRGLTMQGRAPDLVASPGGQDSTSTWFLDTMVSPWFAGFVLAGLLAAIMSSANSFIAVGASALMRDLPSAFGREVRRELLWARVASTVVVVCALLFALYLAQVVFLLGAIGWAAFAAAIFGPLVLGLYWKRATALATSVAVAYGIVANLALTLLTSEEIITLPAYFSYGGAIITSGIVLFIAVSLLAPSQGSAEHFDRLLEAPRESNGRIDRLVMACLVILTVATAGMVLDWWQPVYYAIPVSVTLFMFLGALNTANQWSSSGVAQICTFGCVMLLGFVAAHATLDSSGTLGGLPTATAIFFYLVWPFTAVAAPLVFTSVYHSWLSRDLIEVDAAAQRRSSTPATTVAGTAEDAGR